MIHLDLFYGIGGAALAVDTVWGRENVEHTFCDNDPFCQQVLKKHWPEAKIYGDINDYIQELTGMPALDYTERYGLSTKTGKQRCSCSLRTRDVHCRHSTTSGGITTSTLDGLKSQGSKVQKQPPIRNGKPFLQGNESGGQSTECFGESGFARTGREKNKMRRVRGRRDIQGWEKQDTSTSPQLQQTAKSNVAVSEVSPQLAQGKQSDNAKVNVPPFILTAGVPCQPASQAGRRKGKIDDRWLWPQTFAVIRELKPTWCVLENVRGLLTLERGVVFQELLATLESIGYQFQCFIIPAVAVNAPHRRDRVWIVAHAKSVGSERRPGEVREKNVRQNGKLH